MPGGFLIGELGGRLVQGKIPESGRTAEQGQPVQNGKAGQHAALQPGEPGHMGYAVPSAAQVYPAAYAALDMLFPMAFQDGRGGDAVHHHIRRPGGGRAVPVPLDVQITAGSRSQDGTFTLLLAWLNCAVPDIRENSGHPLKGRHSLPPCISNLYWLEPAS